MAQANLQTWGLRSSAPCWPKSSTATSKLTLESNGDQDLATDLGDQRSKDQQQFTLSQAKPAFGLVACMFKP